MKSYEYCTALHNLGRHRPAPFQNTDNSKRTSALNLLFKWNWTFRYDFESVWIPERIGWLCGTALLYTYVSRKFSYQKKNGMEPDVFLPFASKVSAKLNSREQYVTNVHRGEDKFCCIFRKYARFFWWLICHEMNIFPMVWNRLKISHSHFSQN